MTRWCDNACRQTDINRCNSGSVCCNKPIVLIWSPKSLVSSRPWDSSSIPSSKWFLKMSLPPPHQEKRGAGCNWKISIAMTTSKGGQCWWQKVQNSYLRMLLSEITKGGETCKSIDSCTNHCELVWMLLELTLIGGRNPVSAAFIFVVKYFANAFLRYYLMFEVCNCLFVCSRVAKASPKTKFRSKHPWQLWLMIM